MQHAFKGATLHQHKSRYQWKKRHIFACPACLFSTKDEREWKKHWREKHTATPGIGPMTAVSAYLMRNRKFR
jgi:hypothetical protein